MKSRNKRAERKYVFDRLFLMDSISSRAKIEVMTSIPRCHSTKHSSTDLYQIQFD